MRQTVRPDPHKLSVHLLICLGLFLVGLSCGGGSSDPSGPSADVVVTLTGPSQVNVGDTPSYTLKISNGGPDAATDVVAALDLVAGFTPVAGQPVTLNGQRITWPATATLAAGASVDLTVDLSVNSTGSGTFAASATSATHDGRRGNNDGSNATARVAVTAAAAPTATDLRISFSGRLIGVSGSSVHLTLPVVNAGPIEATNVILELALPDQVVASNLSPAGGVRANGRITWTLGTLGTGQTQNVTLDLVVPLLSLTPLVATVNSATTESSPGNNSASASLRAGVGAVYTVGGEGAGDTFGWEAQNVGDVNGDGRNDFVVTAPYNDAGGTNAGRAYVYSGANGSLLYMVTGDTPLGELGLSVSAVGDIDGDGISEIALGAPFASTGAAPGYVLVVSGATGATVVRFTSTAPTQAGYSVAGTDDLTGDGVRDILVGVPGRSPGGIFRAGTVLVVSGATGAAVASVDGTVANAVFGAGVGSMGDLNGDMVADFAVGSSGEAGGRVRVFSGADGSLLYPAISVPNGGTLGQYWLFTPGDIDGDGTPDIYTADINNSTGGQDRGQAYIFSGKTGGLIRTINGEAAGGQFGMGRPIGDVTGDGISDFVLAAWLSSEGAVNAGKLYVVDGATGQTVRSLVSTVAGETLGFDVLGLGDVTGDGLVDYLITGGQGLGAGYAYMIAGVPMP